MQYDLMLLADPGPDRQRVLDALQRSIGVRADPELDNRFWMLHPAGQAQINIGTKDPVESIHLEFEIGDPALSESVTQYALSLATALEMRVEDMQYGHEIDETSLPALRSFWKEHRPPLLEEPAPAGKRRWWKVW